MDLTHYAMQWAVFASAQAERGIGIEVPVGDGWVFGFGYRFAIDEQAEEVACPDGSDMVPACWERVIPGHLVSGGPRPYFA